MTDAEIRSWLRNYFEEEFDITELKDEDEFINDLGLSSLEVFTLLADMECEFDVKISEKLIRQMVTVQDMCTIVEQLILSKG